MNDVARAFATLVLASIRDENATQKKLRTCAGIRAWLMWYDSKAGAKEFGAMTAELAGVRLLSKSVVKAMIFFGQRHAAGGALAMNR